MSPRELRELFCQGPWEGGNRSVSQILCQCARALLGPPNPNIVYSIRISDGTEPRH